MKLRFDHVVIHQVLLTIEDSKKNRRRRRRRRRREIELFRNSLYCQKTERYLIRCFFLFHIYTIQDALNLFLLNMLEYSNMIMINFLSKVIAKVFHTFIDFFFWRTYLCSRFVLIFMSSIVNLLFIFFSYVV